MERSKCIGGRLEAKRSPQSGLIGGVTKPFYHNMSDIAKLIEDIIEQADRDIVTREGLGYNLMARLRSALDELRKEDQCKQS